MYGYHWLKTNGIFKIDVNNLVQKEIRPVFKEELDFFEMYKKWDYPNTTKPILWAEGIRKYVLNGKVIAHAKGGGLYSKPVVQIKDANVKSLEAIDTGILVTTNIILLEGLVQRAIAYIRKIYEQYVVRGYKFVVAFSGGKDSLVLLDLVQRALAPDQFVVIFGDTGMELSDTYHAVKLAKEKWSNLNFQTARSDFTAEESWKEFGPPGRRLRWCCSVHKSVPTLLLLRQLTGQKDIKAVVFDGVRAEESMQRSSYIELSEGKKHVNQINCSPILEWNSAELYLYILQRDILLNQAYRKGLFRVGCAVCPMSSKWWDGITSITNKEDIAPFRSIVEEYARNNKPAKEVKKYVDQGGWKGRIGGRGVKNGGNRVNEVIEDDQIIFYISRNTQEWIDVARILGPIIDRDTLSGEQIIKGKTFKFTVNCENGLKVMYKSYHQMDRFIVSWLRGVANKVAYCIGCKTCVVECPTGAFEIDENRKIRIRQNECIHCMNCVTGIVRGCWVAKSLSTTQGGNDMNLKGMNRYQHFGLRNDWLEHFFDMQNNCWNSRQLGNRQYDSLKVWLKEAEIIEVNSQTDKNGQISLLGEKLIKLGPFSSFVWSVIWTNLSYNSTLVKWYCICVATGEIYEKKELSNMIGDDYSVSQRDNATSSLSELFRHSPIGNTLDMGVPIPSGRSFKFNKKGWQTPEAPSLLYALYRYAEKLNGHYNFTLKELARVRKNRPVNFIGMEPVTLFGLDESKFKEMVRSISIYYPDFIEIDFDADLDNIRLNPEKSSLGVVDLVIKGEL